MDEYISRTIGKLAAASCLSDRRDFRAFVGELIRTVELGAPISMTFGETKAIIEPTDIRISRSRLMVARHGVQFSMLGIEADYRDGADGDEFAGYILRDDEMRSVPVAFVAAERAETRLAA